MKLSAAMTAALEAIVARFDAANAAENTRWGKPLSGGIDMHLVEGLTRATMRALERAGAITVENRAIESRATRRGAYGQRLGGTKSVIDCAHSIRPTDAGRAWLRCNTKHQQRGMRREG